MSTPSRTPTAPRPPAQPDCCAQGTTTTGELPSTGSTSSASHRRGLVGWILAVLGAVLGLLPHVLHHIGLIAGTALLLGTGATWTLGVVGLLATVPMLLRLRRRFGTWVAPAIGVVVFIVGFLVSALVIGPALGGGADTPVPDPVPAPISGQTGHEGHHR